MIFFSLDSSPTGFVALPRFTEEYHWATDKRAKWGDGPWDYEADKLVWIDPVTGLDCMIHRNYMGALCGYVGVPVGHPYHGITWEDEAIDVHAAINFTALCQPTFDDPSYGVCHLSGDEVWWIGFDNAHMDDLVPQMQKLMTEIGHGEFGAWQTYKTVPYAVMQVTMLAAELAAKAG